jgi:RNase P/RNase MRP subunit p29
VVTKNDILLRTLINTQLEIIESSNSKLIGLSGVLVNESKELFFIRTLNNEIKKVLKKIVIFIIIFPDNTKIKIDGKLLFGTLSDRIKKYK